MTSKVTDMNVTSYTDYALRVLIYLGVQPEGKRSNIKDISDLYHISFHHISKVVYDLGKLGLVTTIRGRNGGIYLAKSPEQINIGELIRHTEQPLHVVECFDEEHNTCKLSPVCQLKGIFHEALTAYFRVLDKYTLQDLIRNKNLLQEVMASRS